MAFIAADNAEKKQKEIREKEAFSKKAEKDEQLKRLDIEIQQVKSEMEKNKDALSGLQQFQQFILELTPDDFKQERENKIRTKKDQAFSEWKQRFKKDFTQDDIIFGEDDEIHEGVKLDALENLLQSS